MMMTTLRPILPMQGHAQVQCRLTSSNLLHGDFNDLSFSLLPSYPES
jgi:hypothetical protein